MSAAQFVERLFGQLPALFRNEAELRKLWGRPETRKGLLEALSEKGFGEAELGEVAKLINAKKSDIYDVLAYIAFAKAPITRLERVASRQGHIFARYDAAQRDFLEFVLNHYVDQGVGELDQSKYRTSWS